MQCPVVQLVSHLLSQSLPAFGAGFDVRVPTPAATAPTTVDDSPAWPLWIRWFDHLPQPRPRCARPVGAHAPTSRVVSVHYTGSRTGRPVGPWPCDRARVGASEAFARLLSLARHLPLLRSSVAHANKQRPLRPTASRLGSPGSAPRGPANCHRRYYERFQTDRRRLAGRTGLAVGLSLGNPLAHRLGSPRLSDACLPDVLTTLTPTEFAGLGDWASCEQRPSHNTPEARRLRAFNITRLIRCEPPNSTGGTLTHELRTLRGLLRGRPVYSNPVP